MARLGTMQVGTTPVRAPVFEKRDSGGQHGQAPGQGRCGSMRLRHSADDTWLLRQNSNNNDIASWHTPQRHPGSQEQPDPSNDPRKWIQSPSAIPQPGSVAWREQEIRRSQELFGKENEPLQYDCGLEEGVQTLLRGDWFYKWSGDTDLQHRRWFWLDRKRWQLYWAKTNQLDHFLSDWIRLQEVCVVETNSIDHNVLGQRGVGVFHIIVLRTIDRTIMLGTAKHGKFKAWFSTLSRLTSRYRKERAQRIHAKHLTPLV